MAKRFLTIWFRYLKTDWFTLRRPELRNKPFALASPDHGRMIITAANTLVEAQGIFPGMVVADARALLPSIEILDDDPTLSNKLLKRLAEWFIRYTPVVAIDTPDGLILDASGCPHIWGGEKQYLQDIITRLNKHGYHTRAAMADTIGAAWAITHFGNQASIIDRNAHTTALLSLPPAALRLDIETIDRLQKLGLRHIRDFITIPRTSLRRRFGPSLLQRLDQALGREEEIIQPVQPIVVYQERLPCLEPIVTATGIEIALQRLLETLCHRLAQEERGLRAAIFKGYRVDGKIENIEIGTHRASHNPLHLFKLFEFKIATIEPAAGIELFTLDALRVEDVTPMQEQLWSSTGGLDDPGLSELMDRINGRFGANHIHRYLPDEHYWPERSVKQTSSLQEELTTDWRNDRPRPLQLLAQPEPIDVTAPIPDYPPMLFRHKGALHKIVKAEGPERIEQEWWLQQGEHRDYYYVEDETGCRYWLFRLGHYTGDKSYQWFLHGYFA
jgi:protein ImuB